MSDISAAYTKEPKVLKWKERIRTQQCTLRSMQPLALLHKPNNELLFGLFTTEVYDKKGHRFPQYVVIRGDACIIVVLVIHASTREEKFVMIRQPRIGSGKHSLEFPAGMLDRHADDPLFVAQKELTEETGLTIPQEYFSPLWEKELYSSVGLLDEGIHYFGCCTEVDDETFDALEGAQTGCAGEDERITTTLRTQQQAMQEASTTQTLLAFTLFSSARNSMTPYPYPQHGHG